MKNSLGFYQFSYINNNAVQVKELITEESYEYYRELTRHEQELQNKLLLFKKEKSRKSSISTQLIEKDQVLVEEINVELKDVKDKLKEFSKPFFTLNSPMYKAIETGFIEMGEFGQHPVKIEKIEYKDNELDYFTNDI